jgi:hypothetical protein
MASPENPEHIQVRFYSFDDAYEIAEGLGKTLQPGEDNWDYINRDFLTNHFPNPGQFSWCVASGDTAAYITASQEFVEYVWRNNPGMIEEFLFNDHQDITWEGDNQPFLEAFPYLKDEEFDPADLILNPVGTSHQEFTSDSIFHKLTSKGECLQMRNWNDEEIERAIETERTKQGITPENEDRYDAEVEAIEFHIRTNAANREDDIFKPLR